MRLRLLLILKNPVAKVNIMRMGAFEKSIRELFMPKVYSITSDSSDLCSPEKNGDTSVFQEKRNNK